LENYGISAERKAIYDDIESLCFFGADIISAGKKGWYIGSRDFELAELKLLVDCVQANRFITEKKSGALIKKLEGLTSKNLAQALHRQVYITNRPKNLNEKIYYNIDTLHDAINSGKQISFRYFSYSSDKKRVYKRDGALYTAHPYSLIVSEENYYLVAYYEQREKITNFRVDRMEDITICEQKVKPSDQSFNMAEYSKKTFNMFTGEQKTVTILCENRYMNAVIDKFGEKISAIPYDENHFTFKVEVSVSPTFFSWIFMFEGGMKILAPESVVEKFNENIKKFI
ncbi:MAG: WYL domain-containing protein, partial [Clostridia bacterium]|nr:WYL domain-containing protein [Clostridia bacterium]